MIIEHLSGQNNIFISQTLFVLHLLYMLVQIKVLYRWQADNKADQMYTVKQLE